MSNIIFVAIHKETGNVMSGQKGQYAFGDLTTLRRSIAYSYSYTAQKAGKKVAELYDIHEIDVDKVLTPAAPQNDKPFVVKEVFGEDYNGEEYVNFKSEPLNFSIGSLSECPEDASLGRDLSFVMSFEGAMRAAYEAGKAGRPYEYIQEVEDREEEE